MTDLNLERSRNRKKSQNEYRKNSFSSKFIAIEGEDDTNNSKLQSNDKIISILGENIINNLKNSLSSNKNIINKQSLSNTNKDKRGSQIKDKESPRSIEKASGKNKKNNQFDICPLATKGFMNDVNIILNGKPIKKSEEELLLEHEYNTIEFFIKSIDKNKALKQMNENKESNYSSSNIGSTNNTKSISMKSEEKNTKINLQNIIENDRRFMRRDCPCIILSDKNNIEKNENKLDLLIKIMEEYKEIIMEKIFCKNFQDRIILSIYISLSQISLKLYNCIENKQKLNNLRKYICGLTDNIKYDLFNNPNFTISSINQKFIDIIDIKNQAHNPINKDKNKINKTEDSIDKNESSLNFNSQSNKDSSSLFSKKKEKYKWFYDDEDEEIIYENFEDFNEFIGNDKDFPYGNNNMLIEADNQKDCGPILNHMDNNFNFNKHISKDEDIGYSSKLSKNKVRRNATHKIAFEKKENTKVNNMLNHTTTGTLNFKHKDYNFQIIDLNGNVNLENIDDSDDSIDSEDGFNEVNENHKYDLPKLVFYEEHVKDKDKRKISKNTHVEIRPDQDFIKDKIRIKELNDIGFKNIITIINKQPNVLPNHELNLNPFEISDFINEREKKLLEHKHNTITSKIENSKKDDENITSKKSENEKENNLESKNNSFFSKSGSFFNDDEFSKDKILNFVNEEDEEDI